MGRRGRTGLAALGLGAALVLIARVTSPGEPTPLAFHDLSTSTTDSWQQTQVAEAPAAGRAPDTETVAPAKPEHEAAFLSWRGAFHAVPPPGGPEFVAGRCVNCPPIDNPGPAATVALCESLANQPLRPPQSLAPWDG